MTDRHQPTTPLRADDEAIEQATDGVVETWKEATPGKDPNATADDFERMRDGFSEVAGGEGGPARD